MKILHSSLEERLSRNLAARRRELHLTQAQLAERLGVDTETLSRFERGKHLPALRTLERLAQLLQTSMASLISEHALEPTPEGLQASLWLADLRHEDRAFAMDQLKRQTDYLRNRQRSNSPSS